VCQEIVGDPSCDLPGLFRNIPLCGNNVDEVGEACDGTDLGGLNCDSLQGSQIGETVLACNHDCTYDESGCLKRFIVNPFSRIIIDEEKGLMWIKQDDGGGIHDKDNLYTWSASGTAFDGTVKTDFLDVLNDVDNGGANCFGGFCDWRLPEVEKDGGLEELDSLVNSSQPVSKILREFNNICGVGCSTTQCSCNNETAFYWSSIPVSQQTNFAWGVRFSDGFTDAHIMTSSRPARAVRTMP